MHYRPEKGDGSAQRGQSVLFTITLFVMFWVVTTDIYAKHVSFFSLSQIKRQNNVNGFNNKNNAIKLSNK